MCVTSNAERLNLTPILAFNFAKRNGLPVITWNLPAEGKLVGRLQEEGTEIPLTSVLVGFFVEGGPAYLTENINPAMSLANGTFAKLHSLSFDYMTPREAAQLRHQIAHAKPGERIHVSRPPTFINIRPVLSDETRAKWNPEFTLVPGDIVLPIGLCSAKTTLDVQVDTATKCLQGAVKVSEHRLELGFAVTFHKIQGKTIPKVILELNKRPFAPHLNHSMLLVAISRVTNRENLRIIPLKAGTTLRYLGKLRPDPKLKTWMTGFDPGGVWSAKRVEQQFVKPKVKEKTQKKQKEKQGRREEASVDKKRAPHQDHLTPNHHVP